MSANEEDGLISLMDVHRSETYLQAKVNKLRRPIYFCFEKMRSGNIEGFWGAFLESLINDERRYWRMMMATMRKREEYVREFINKEEIYVSEAAHLEAVIFLKREGWTGKALIHQEEFARELSKNSIPFILQAP